MICSMGTTYRLQHKVHSEKTAIQENAVSVISVDKSTFYDKIHKESEFKV